MIPQKFIQKVNKLESTQDFVFCYLFLSLYCCGYHFCCCFCLVIGAPAIMDRVLWFRVLSFCLSVFSGNVRGISSLVFSETLYCVRGQYQDVCDRSQFLEKSPSGENYQKWSKMTSSENSAYVGKILFSSYDQKCSRPKCLIQSP